MIFEIYERSETGNFPAADRDVTLQQVEASEIYFQDKIANEATATKKQKFVA